MTTTLVVSSISGPVDHVTDIHILYRNAEGQFKRVGPPRVLRVGECMGIDVHANAMIEAHERRIDPEPTGAAS